jgi:serine/threonine-protein kinase RsbW
VSHPLLLSEQRRAQLAVQAAFAIRSSADFLPVFDGVMAALGGWHYPDRDVFGVRMALEEALVNAIKHGHRGDPSKVVRVSYQVTKEKVLIEVEDQGPGFNLAHVPDPLAPENMERSSGRGLLLIQHYMTWAKYEGRGNRVILCKYRSVS